MIWAILLLAVTLLATYYKYRKGDNIRVLLFLDAIVAVIILGLWYNGVESSKAEHAEVVRNLKEMDRKHEERYDEILGELKELRKKDQETVKKVYKENEQYLEEMFNGGYVYFTHKGNRVLMSNPSIPANWTEASFSAKESDGRTIIVIDRLKIKGMSFSNNKFGLPHNAQVRQPIGMGIGGSDWLLGTILIDNSIPNTPIWVIGYYSEQLD